jgi:multiple sugar transport system substrate-binding protein
MQRIDRRRLFKLSGAGAVAAGAGGIAGILATGRAPAFAQATTLHWVKPVDFVPVSDQLLKGKLKDECRKALGISLNVETIEGNGVQARTTSAIQSGAGPDIIMELNNWAQLYADSTVDMSDLAEEVGNAQKGYFDTSKAVAFNGRKWVGMPFTILGAQIVNRTSWWNEIGITPDKYPTTWDDYHAAGKKLKAKEHPFGQTLAHTFGDAPTFWYPYLWSWGGKEVETDGKTVALDSKETLESVKFAVALWKDCFDDGGMAWDDSGNNRAFLSGTISAALNGASIYLLAKAKPDSYLSDKGTPLKDDMFHTALPKGPAGQFSYHLPFVNVIPTYGKNQKAAKDFLRWFHSKDVFEEWFTSQQGFCVGPTKMWMDDKVWQVDPIMAPFRTAVESGKFAGYPATSGRAAAEAVTKYIIVDMYAKAVQGMAPEDSVKWAHAELVKIYA